MLGERADSYGYTVPIQLWLVLLPIASLTFRFKATAHPVQIPHQCRLIPRTGTSQAPEPPDVPQAPACPYPVTGLHFERTCFTSHISPR